jgi:hypothetical protein
MDSNLVEIVCILDKSGSMYPLKEDAVGGFNSFLSKQKELPGKANFTLVLFNTFNQKIHDRINIQEAKPLTIDVYAPCNGTALLDAVGTTVDDLGKKLDSTPEHERPSKIIIAILTDGMENSSRKFDREQIFNKIKHQQDKYNWEFLFLAANQDAISVGSSLSFNPKSCFTYASTADGTLRAYNVMTQNVSASRISGTKPKDKPVKLENAVETKI